ncbi:hypothetical protein ABZP36_009443 [Zizania latifolia]
MVAMGAKGVASAAAETAVLVYLVLSGRLSSGRAGYSSQAPRRRRRGEEENEFKKRWPERAPASWREAAAVAARTVGFTYSETLGKWPLGDIAFGIKHYMRIQVCVFSAAIAAAFVLADHKVADLDEEK